MLYQYDITGTSYNDFLIQDLEERERNFYASQNRSEITIQGLQHDVKYHEERVRECEKKIRQLEHNMSEEVQLKERARLNLQVYGYNYRRIV